MAQDTAQDQLFIPEDILRKSHEATGHLIPNKSSLRYDKEFKLFCQWKMDSNVNFVNEDVMMAYFLDLSNKFKSSSLWSKYSMVKSMLLVHENLDISTFPKLKAFLKKQAVGYQPIKSKILTLEELNRFMTEAPDKEYLLIKVIAMFGITGGCRREELYAMKVKDIEDTGTQLVVTIPQTKTNQRRVFTVINQDYIKKYKTYLKLRPKNVGLENLFIAYRKGRCISQRVGIHSIADAPKKIATFLGLPEADKFTGHCFRRTSATILADAGADLLVLKRHGGWKSSSVAEKYIEDSIEGKNRVSRMIQHGENFVEVLQQKNGNVSASSNSLINNSSNGAPGIHIHGNENLTVNINISNK